MYTSYFANVKNIKYPVAISLSVPAFYKGPIYRTIAPWWELLNEYKQNKQYDSIAAEKMYTLKFKEKLSNLNVSKVFEDLYNIYNTDECCLLCYEKSTDFCHRHLVAEWFRLNDIKCFELRPGIKQN